MSGLSCCHRPPLSPQAVPHSSRGLVRSGGGGDTAPGGETQLGAAQPDAAMAALWLVELAKRLRLVMLQRLGLGFSCVAAPVDAYAGVHCLQIQLPHTPLQPPHALHCTAVPGADSCGCGHGCGHLGAARAGEEALCHALALTRQSISCV
jgi:hypothetical protein